MTRADNQFEADARQIAQQVEADHATGQQLSLIPDEQGQAPADARRRGRPAGAKNKGSSQMREWLARRGAGMPEDRLIEMAGLSPEQRSEDLLTWAIGRTEAVCEGLGLHKPKDRLDVFKLVYGHARGALESLLPYIAAKAAPDVQVNQNMTLVLPGGAAPAQPGDGAQVVQGRARPVSAPPPLPYEMQQNQQVADDGGLSDTGQTRTDQASD